MTAPGLIIAAPRSGSGKTVFTLGLLRALRRRGVAVASAKVGPDYIDPAFHAAAGGRACYNIDGWAMRPETVAGRVTALGQSVDLVVCEGVMGLFDGAAIAAPADIADTRLADGSTADIAARTGWPVILLVDLSGQAASAAALVLGFTRYRADVTIAGVVFNRTGGGRHQSIVERATNAACPGLPVLGWLPKNTALALPERHLGLVQAGETADLDPRLDAAADLIEAHIDLDRLVALARPAAMSAAGWTPPLSPHGKTIAVAADAAFAFAYPAILDGWRSAGSTLSFFSPLADEGPAADADAVYLPGGYPELHAGRLAGNGRFLDGLRAAAAAGAWVFGECGGYMVLGRRLEDADGVSHAMAGLLPVSTSFAKRRLHLGYRTARLCADTPFGPAGASLRGHEFHYASITADEGGTPLFAATDAAGVDKGHLGHIAGRVMGSFIHVLDRA